MNERDKLNQLWSFPKPVYSEEFSKEDHEKEIEPEKDEKIDTSWPFPVSPHREPAEKDEKIDTSWPFPAREYTSRI